MDRDEKINRLLDMQEHPGQYSDEALEQMLNDPEARGLMEATAQLKRAMQNDEFIMSEQDIDNEWQRFASARLASQKPERRWLKIAAMFIGVLLLSGIAFAAVHIFVGGDPSVERDPSAGGNMKSPTQGVRVVNPHQPAGPSADSVVFENVTLDSIARDIAAYHHIGMDLQNDQAGQLRFFFLWNQEDSLQEVIEKLNMFDHINMAVEDGKLIVR